MSVEQVARDFVTNINDVEMMKDVEEMKGRVADDAVSSGGVLPQAFPLMEAIKIMNGLMAAIPDLKIDIQQGMVNGNHRLR